MNRVDEPKRDPLAPTGGAASGKSGPLQMHPPATASATHAAIMIDAIIEAKELAEAIANVRRAATTRSFPSSYPGEGCAV